MILERYRMDRTYHAQNRQAEIIAMALKPKPKLKGTDVRRTHRFNPETGILEPIKKKLSPPAEYSRSKRKKWRAAK